MRQYSIEYWSEHMIWWGYTALNMYWIMLSVEAMHRWILVWNRRQQQKTWPLSRVKLWDFFPFFLITSMTWAILLSVLPLGFPSACLSPGDEAWRITSSNLCSVCRSFHVGAVGRWEVQPLPLWSRHGLSRVQDREPSTVEAWGRAAADRDDCGERYCATCRCLGYIQIYAYLLYMASCNVLSVC